MTTQLVTKQSISSLPLAPATTQNCIIVVPCYNEERRLNGAEFKTFAAENPNVSFLFVDDGSADGTREVLSALCSTNPEQLSAMSLSKNCGKAEAVRQGLLHASSMGAEMVGYWDADLATPLDAIIDFVRVSKKFRGVSVIFGSRRPLLGHRIQRTLFRRFVSRICSTLAYQALQLPISDTQCGAKMFRNSTDLRASLAQPFSAGWLFDVELFARLAKRLQSAENSFYELPLAEWHEIAGSKVSSKAILRAGFSMLRLILEMRIGLKPKVAPQSGTAVASVIATARFDHPTLAA